MGNLCSQLNVRDPETYHHQVELHAAPVHLVHKISFLYFSLNLLVYMQSGWEQPAGVVTLEPARSSGYAESSPTRQSNVSFYTLCSQAVTVASCYVYDINFVCHRGLLLLGQHSTQEVTQATIHRSLQGYRARPIAQHARKFPQAQVETLAVVQALLLQVIAPGTAPPCMLPIGYYCIFGTSLSLIGTFEFELKSSVFTPFRVSDHNMDYSCSVKSRESRVIVQQL